MLETLIRAYKEAVEFTDGPNFGGAEFSPELVQRIETDCRRFWDENHEHINDGSQAGHDFWLTRNRHGAGFWDGDWEEPAATILTDAAHRFGECELYVGDDGKVYAL